LTSVVGPIEKQLDPRKARLYRILFLLGGIGMFGLCGVLIWIFVDKRELPALLLGLVALFWAVVLIYQSLKMRRFKTGEDDTQGPGGGETGEP
jgi:uncharacterized membrane protein YqjE